MHVQKGAKDSTCPAAWDARPLIWLNAVGAIRVREALAVYIIARAARVLGRTVARGDALPGAV